jgi:class 3 adenylate cyclase
MRVWRAFGFVDLSGSTNFIDTHPDEESIRVLARVRAAVREISSAHGVRVAKWLGDGAMFVSVAAEPLVATVLDVEEQVDADNSPLALRAGMSSGEAILFEGDDYIGTPVNIAARLCDLAGPHNILATEDLATAIPPDARAIAGEAMLLHGFAAPIPVLRVGRLQHGEEHA